MARADGAEVDRGHPEGRAQQRLLVCTFPSVQWRDFLGSGEGAGYRQRFARLQGELEGDAQEQPGVRTGATSAQGAADERREPLGNGSERRPQPHGSFHPAKTGVRGARPPRRRRGGRRGPDRFDADYYLIKLQEELVRERRSAGDTDTEISDAILRLQQKSSGELAAAIQERFKVRKDGRTIRRNSKVYAEWRRRRTAEKGRRPIERGGPRRKKAVPRTRSECAEADAIGGQLSQREKPDGRLHGHRTREDCLQDAETDAWFRENGVDPKEFRAE